MSLILKLNYDINDTIKVLNDVHKLVIIFYDNEFNKLLNLSLLPDSIKELTIFPGDERAFLGLTKLYFPPHLETFWYYDRYLQFSNFYKVHIPTSLKIVSIGEYGTACHRFNKDKEPKVYAELIKRAEYPPNLLIEFNTSKYMSSDICAVLNKKLSETEADLGYYVICGILKAITHIQQIQTDWFFKDMESINYSLDQDDDYDYDDVSVDSMS